MKKLYTPTVGQLITELKKYNRDSKLWVEMNSDRVTPIGHLDGGYNVTITEGSYADTVFVRFEG